MKRELKLDGRPHNDRLQEHCKAYPDEKGIETLVMSDEDEDDEILIAKPIPMKRELKPRA